jgi:dTDP-4-dehydrorhamnose reductase
LRQRFTDSSKISQNSEVSKEKIKMKKKIYAVTGYRGKIGSLLTQRANFVPLECDVTDQMSIKHALNLVEVTHGKVDGIINCAAISSIKECEEDYEKAKEVNANGLKNLHRVFGERVLCISSDHVFDGTPELKDEESDQNPVNAYGTTKFGAEAISYAFSGKTIRLSRTVSITDPDIYQYLYDITNELPVEVPNFIFRNYTTRQQAVDGIVHFVRNWDTMPEVVNYGNLSRVSMWQLVHSLVKHLKFDADRLVIQRNWEIGGECPRPFYGGFSTYRAESLKFPVYYLGDTVSGLRDEYYD